MKQIIVYSTPTCPFCHKAKEYLKEKGIEYKDINVVDNEAKQQEMMDKSGQMGVPVIDIGGTIIVGFDKNKMDVALGL
jgi:glutaredoxin 3